MDATTTETEYCGCCGGDAAQAPKGEHAACCNEQHDVKAMTRYLYEEDSGEEAEFEAADMDAAKAHGEALLRQGLDRQLAAIRRSGRTVDFPVEVTGHVTEQRGEYNSWADGNPAVPTVQFTATAAGFPA